MLKSVNIDYFLNHQTSMAMLRLYVASSIDDIIGNLGDAIEWLKLELEFEGKSEIGSAYESGSVYYFYADLKEIISRAQTEIIVIDPYFSGEAFGNYFSSIPKNISIKILANEYIKDIRNYADKHIKQFQSKIHIRKSNELHDRILVIDNTDCWTVGQSINHAADKKPTYLIPFQPPIAEAKIRIYAEIWKRAKER